MPRFKEKLCSLSEAVDYIKDGTRIHFGGMSVNNHPMAFIYELIRHGVKDLTIVGAVSSMDVDILVGAGTVLTIEQVKLAMDAGATFIVAPGFNPKVVGYCLKHNIPMTPGVATPTDIEAALDLGLTILKYFPAEAFGGLNTLKAISAPYTNVKFIPTGGINTLNVATYLAHPKVVACGGSWMVKSTFITSHQFDTITRLTREAVTLVQNL